ITADFSCTMSPVTFKDLPLDIYMVIFGTGIFVFILSLIFCCYFIRSHVTTVHATCVYKALQLIVKIVVLGGNRRKTCAVCLEDFRLKEELGVLPCQHAFHRRCLVKWLEVRCVCPMCNKPIAGPLEHQVQDLPPPQGCAKTAGQRNLSTQVS
uniref:Ring finger protein 122 n=1 Tax=Scleropages formosus TaxID=113540 RepID=A0A8C9RUB9_SCLFO